ncbi:MAG: C39 family peptidase [Candidatus Nomurabacteria bacterium]
MKHLLNIYKKILLISFIFFLFFNFSKAAGDPTIKIGDQGSAITKLVRVLKQHNCLPSDYNDLTDHFTQSLGNYLINFQNNNNISTAGTPEVGTNTWEALNANVGDTLKDGSVVKDCSTVTTNNSPAASTAGVSDYQNISSFSGESTVTTSITNKDTGALGDVFNYILTIMSVLIIVLIVFRVLQGALIKGTLDNVYASQKAKQILSTAGKALIIFIFTYAILTFINPDLTGWTFVSSAIGLDSGNNNSTGGNCAPILPKLTAYSPQSSTTNNNSKMEGGLGSAQPGLDGQSVVRTLEDVRTGKSAYVTLAGDSATYKSKYTIPSITYINTAGQKYTLSNVTAYVHDTGGAFKGAGYTHFDVAVDINMPTSAINKEPAPFGSNTLSLSPQECQGSIQTGSDSVADKVTPKSNWTYTIDSSVKYYSQCDPKWANDLYAPQGHSTMCKSACGPTSLAMVITQDTGKEVLPTTIAKLAADKGYKTPNSGTDHSAIPNILKVYNLTSKEYDGASGWNQAKTFLSKGNLIIVIFGPGHFTQGGHYEVITSMSNGTVFLNNPYPNNNIRDSKGVPESWVANEGKIFWVVSK